MPLSADGKQFTNINRTADYECDLHGRMKLSAILQHMQEISSAHLDALGIPYTLLLENRQVFLLSKIQVTIIQRPTAAQLYTLLTVPKTPVGAQFVRSNAFLDAQGEPLIRTEATWMLVDPESRRILRPCEFIDGMRHIGEGSSPLPRFRLSAPEVSPVGERPVRLSDLDVNRHINNAVYADICTDFLPEAEFLKSEPESFYIHFCSEARLGDTLRILRGEAGPGGYYFRAEKAGGTCFEALLRLHTSCKGE